MSDLWSQRNEREALQLGLSPALYCSIAEGRKPGRGGIGEIKTRAFLITFPCTFMLIVPPSQWMGGRHNAKMKGKRVFFRMSRCCFGKGKCGKVFFFFFPSGLRKKRIEVSQRVSFCKKSSEWHCQNWISLCYLQGPELCPKNPLWSCLLPPPTHTWNPNTPPPPIKTADVLSGHGKESVVTSQPTHRVFKAKDVPMWFAIVCLCITVLWISLKVCHPNSNPGQLGMCIPENFGYSKIFGIPNRWYSD